METTFDKFINNCPEQKVLFDKEYAEFSSSERKLENFNRERQTKPFVIKNKIAQRRYSTV